MIFFISLVIFFTAYQLRFVKILKSSVHIKHLWAKLLLLLNLSDDQDNLDEAAEENYSVDS